MSYPNLYETGGIGTFFDAVDQEVRRQLDKWGAQDHADGTSHEKYHILEAVAKAECDHAEATGNQSWALIGIEEMMEAAASDPDSPNLDVEIVQVAAVMASWYLARRRREYRSLIEHPRDH